MWYVVYSTNAIEIANKNALKIISNHERFIDETESVFNFMVKLDWSFTMDEIVNWSEKCFAKAIQNKEKRKKTPNEPNSMRLKSYRELLWMNKIERKEVYFLSPHIQRDLIICCPILPTCSIANLFLITSIRNQRVLSQLLT